MPELRECLAHFIFIVWVWEHLKEHGNWRLLAIWADATSTDKNPKPANLDCVHMLDANNKWKRGTKSSQTYLWPAMWGKTSSNPHPPPITTLELKGIRKTNRSLILDFGNLWFQVSLQLILLCCNVRFFILYFVFCLQLSYLTHTSVQFYKRSMWKMSVCGVPSTVHTFSSFNQ
jgi:hypothetical protein